MFFLIDLLVSAVDEFSETLTEVRERRRSPFAFLYPVIFVLVVLLGAGGLLALQPACWMVAGALIVVGLPAVGVLDHRYKVRHGLYTPEAVQALRRSIRTWILFAVVIGGAFGLVLWLASRR